MSISNTTAGPSSSESTAPNESTGRRGVQRISLVVPSFAMQSRHVRDEEPDDGSYADVLADVATLVEEARRGAARSINAVMATTYWEVGRRIVEREQAGGERAGYGEGLLSRLSANLTKRFGRGFSVDRLETARLFYLAYPPIASTSDAAKISATPSRKLAARKSATGARDVPPQLGGDFAFIGRQRRLRVGSVWYRVDLLFFHRRLRCLVVVDLKLGRFTHSDARQMHLYLNYAREHWMFPARIRRSACSSVVRRRTPS